MKLDREQLKEHALEAINVYQVMLGSPQDAFWIIHPRDYHILKDLFPSTSKGTPEYPEILNLPAITAYVWRKPPIIAVNIDDVESLLQ